MHDQNDGHSQQLSEVSERPFDSRRPFVVVNPRAANGEVGENWEQVRALLESTLGAFDFAMTDAPMAAARLAREALKSGHDLIASLGGDGTHNETVNGFFEGGQVINPAAALAILPCGTGGDFRKSLDLSGDMREAALRIASGSPSPCDVGRVRFVQHDGQEAERYFINIASFGISGLVDKKANTSSKALGGKASFMLALVRALSEFTPQRVRMVIDDRIDVQAPINNVAVANGRFFGGGMKVAPFARIDDGFFNIVIIREMSLSDVVLTGIKVYDGKHLESPHISHLQARKLFAEPMGAEGDEVLLDIDGEAPGRLPATFEILPGAIRIWS